MSDVYDRMAVMSPRTPDGLSARTQMLSIRMTAPMVRLLDRLRGESTRSEYIRSLVAAEARRNRKEQDR